VLVVIGGFGLARQVIVQSATVAEVGVIVFELQLNLNSPGGSFRVRTPLTSLAPRV
jgi:hypothetical protein